MINKNRSLALFIPAAIFVISFLSVGTASAAGTNVTSTAKYHWAWNDVVGWMDFYNTNTVVVSSSANVQGYASSSAGYISLDCTTYPNPPPPGEQNICGSSGNFGVYNPGNGALTGWGWNDEYGWISFCGGRNISNCPGSTGYEVLIGTNASTTSGSDFTGYAWNDVIGWISFNCRDGNFCGTSDYKVNTAWTSSSTSGYLDSSAYDTGVAGGAEINSIVWQGSAPSNATGTVQVKFQIAASNSSNGPWNFVGYDGTGNTFYPQLQGGVASPNVSVPLSYVLHNNDRYFRYRVYLYSDEPQKQTPTINDITVNWSP